MTNKVDTIVTAIKNSLISAGILAVYRYPEELNLIGNRFPAAIIREESKDYIATSGQRYEYELTLSITLISDEIRERMKAMNDLEVIVFNALFSTSTLGGLVLNINPVRVEIGELLTGNAITSQAGFTEAQSFRTITINCLVQDSRV